MSPQKSKMLCCYFLENRGNFIRKILSVKYFFKTDVLKNILVKYDQQSAQK